MRRRDQARAGVVSMSEPTEFFPSNTPYIKRVGYRGFLSLVWMLWRMNRSAKLFGIKTKAEITLPVRWLK